MNKSQQRVLIVDNSNLARVVISRHLKSALPDVYIVSAPSGEEAQAMLEADEIPFDLITTALVLPGLSGLELCSWIRQSNTHGGCPVVIVSSDEGDVLEKEGFKAGVTEYFNKNRGETAFVDYVKSYLQRNKNGIGHVLYVEDSRTAAVAGKRMMLRHGLKVTVVTSAEEAIEMLESFDEKTMPDIVVTDFILKGDLTGGDLLSYIRSRMRLSTHELPVLVVTGGSNSDKHGEVLHRGANDFIEKPFTEEILIARIKNLAVLKQMFDALKRQQEEMHRLAITDRMTGCLNKGFLLDHGQNFMDNSHHNPVSVIISDIDHFKSVNDTHGHLIGDQVLREMGKLLNTLIPPETGHLVCRFGGEEFVMVLKNTGRKAASEVAETIRLKLIEAKPAGLELTTSLGVAGTDVYGETTLSKLIGLADEALYACKGGGRNCVHYQTKDGPERVIEEA